MGRPANPNRLRFVMSARHESVTTTIQVDAGVEEVACDGGGSFGHPLVYLPFGNKDEVVCYYCGRRFRRSPSKPHEAKSP